MQVSALRRKAKCARIWHGVSRVHDKLRIERLNSFESTTTGHPPRAELKVYADVLADALVHQPPEDLTAYELYLRALAPSAKGSDNEQIVKALGHLGKAIDRALELKPNIANGWLRSGWIRLMDGQPEPAI